MRRSVNSLLGYAVHATDGCLGQVEEFLFDDATWTIRYLVINTGGWLLGREVLISPVALGTPDWESQEFPVKLTREQVRNSPSIDTDLPVSRQHEIDLHAYYEWPAYWGGGFCATGGYVAPAVPSIPSAAVGSAAGSKQDPHLRSTQAVTGYRIHAVDGDIGHVEDFILDDDKWSIGFLVVCTRNWLPGRKVLLDPEWIKEVSWAEAKVAVGLSCDKIRNSPEYDPCQPVNHDYEGQLYDYYGRPLNWR